MPPERRPARWAVSMATPAQRVPAWARVPRASLCARACALAPRPTPLSGPRGFPPGHHHVSRPGPSSAVPGERKREAMIRLGGWCARWPRGAVIPAARRWRWAAGPVGPAGRRALRVLVDMDGVLADFEGGFLRKFRARFPDQPFIALEDRRGFWLSEQYGRLQPGLSEKANSILESENFFFDLEPLPGAVEAVKQMANLENSLRGHIVSIRQLSTP